MNMFPFFFLFALALGDSSPSEDPQGFVQCGNCPMFWFDFNGRCYKYVASRLSWADAELHCVEEGANLVSIHSLGEQKFVDSLVKNFDPSEGPTWIGLSDIHKEGSWMWSDGSAPDFLYWSNNEPNNLGVEHCVHDNHGAELRWNDKGCDPQFPSVCVSRVNCSQLQK